MGSCIDCNFHDEFWDEEFGSDGCFCSNENADIQDYHINGCREYCNFKDIKDCPYWIKKQWISEITK